MHNQPVLVDDEIFADDELGDLLDESFLGRVDAIEAAAALANRRPQGQNSANRHSSHVMPWNDVDDDDDDDFSIVDESILRQVDDVEAGLAGRSDQVSRGKSAAVPVEWKDEDWLDDVIELSSD
jgi:hypothetical protein